MRSRPSGLVAEGSRHSDVAVHAAGALGLHGAGACPDTNLRLLCAQSEEATALCAWTGPGIDGRHPPFGIVRAARPNRESTDAEMTAFAEKVFEAMTPAS